MRLLRKLGKWLLGIAIVLALPALYLGINCRGDAGSPSRNPLPLPAAVQTYLDAVPEYKFPEEKSYLTFPEWYIVYASQDYARHIAAEKPSSFAYLMTTLDFWTSYCRVNQLTSSRYPQNFGAQVMIYVIGISHSAEFLVKGLYENTLGRIYEWLSPATPVEEEVFAQRFALAYGEWLNTIPWYEFDFWSQLKMLWSDVPLTGEGQFRKLERRVVLSAELALKTVYGWMIGGGTKAAYVPAKLEILAVMTGTAADIASVDQRLRIEKEFGDGLLLVRLPRYQPFTDIAVKLAGTSAQFVEIGGNRRILMSFRQSGRTTNSDVPLFAVEVLAPAGGLRTAYDVEVPKLLDEVRRALAEGRTLEHIYDY